MAVHPDLLDLIRCPKCLGRLHERGDRLCCEPCRVFYPVVDEIPQLLVDEARPLEAAAGSPAGLQGD